MFSNVIWFFAPVVKNGHDYMINGIFIDAITLGLFEQIQNGLKCPIK